jgi:RecA-family ATPase
MQGRLKSITKNSVIESGNFKLITPDLQDITTPNLANEECQAELASFTSDADLIIVDNISTLCRTGQENDSDQWTPVQRWALTMRSEGRSVLFVHHSNKNGGQRGTSGREDVLDTVISLKKPSGSSPTEGANFEVHFEKNRGFSGQDADSFNASLSINNEEQIWTRQAIADSSFDRTLKLAKEGLTCSEIAKELSLNKSTTSRHIAKAKEKGLLPESVQ